MGLIDTVITGSYHFIYSHSDAWREEERAIDVLDMLIGHYFAPNLAVTIIALDGATLILEEDEGIIETRETVQILSAGQGLTGSGGGGHG